MPTVNKNKWQANKYIYFDFSNIRIKSVTTADKKVKDPSTKMPETENYILI